MEFSENITEIAPALAKAWGETETPKHNKEVTVQKKAGGTYTFNYTTLAGIMDAIRKPFKDNGLFVLQDVKTEKEENSRDTVLTIKTFIYHTSGQFMSGGELTVKAAFDMQGLGGQITYLKRYSLSSVLGLATEQDDDGNAPEAFVTPEEAKGYTNQTKSGNNRPPNQPEQPKGPVMINNQEIAAINKKLKEVADTQGFDPKEAWPRIRALYSKPGKTPVPASVGKLTQAMAGSLAGVLDDHIQGLMLPPVPKREENPKEQTDKGAGENEPTKETGDQ